MVEPMHCSFHSEFNETSMQNIYCTDKTTNYHIYSHTHARARAHIYRPRQF
jgi:hypothetical protein